MYRHVQKVKRGDTTQNPHLDNKIRKLLDQHIEITYHKFYDNIEQEDAAYIKEDEVIQGIGLENLCNVWYGGKGGRIPSDEVRQKISKNRTGIPVSEETKEKIRQSKLGVPQSQETKQKKSLKLKGKPQTKKQQDANIQRSASMSGRKFTEEHKQKLREAKLINPTKYWLGKQLPEDVKQKISETLKSKSENHNEQNG
jgi:hypothetical protein